MGSMTRTEWQAWASLAALLAIYWWFQMRLLDGFEVVEQPARELLGVFFVVAVLSTLSAIAIGAIGTGARKVVSDERDHAIAARANQNERFFIIAAVYVLLWQALMEGVFTGHALPKIDLTSLPVLVFWLLTILFAAEAVRLVSTIALYRLQSAAG
jgi:hypothetical protein